MQIAVTGATGLIGRELIRQALERGDHVRALSRDSGRAREKLGQGIEVYEWPDPKSAPPPPAATQGADAVIHLLGEPIAQRWSQQAKREIRDSRVLATRQLVAGLGALPESERPGVLVSQSATGLYGPRGEEEIAEETGPGDDFLAGVVVDWEREASQVESLGTRLCLPRTGVVLAPSEGALAKMLPPFRLGVGGPVAGGRQYVPWIHLQDVVGALLCCAQDERYEGALNLSSPHPATNAELSQALGRVLNRPAVMPVPALAVKLMYGEMASVVTTGQRAVPARLQQLGYRFTFPELEPALRDVLQR